MTNKVNKMDGDCASPASLFTNDDVGRLKKKPGKGNIHIMSVFPDCKLFSTWNHPWLSKQDGRRPKREKKFTSHIASHPKDQWLRRRIFYHKKKKGLSLDGASATAA
ncbi:hypothetical protein Ocin01_13256 [Orchesella cincta]|uniref:Uncharacterized protein n=1 Tax=Orchesella cincta TaxID=48709 RepID=A0A1D2MKJ0_ORCCI|nr:hypothetical protein Ocin01_13256 [Orchesella cincta]